MQVGEKKTDNWDALIARIKKKDKKFKGKRMKIDHDLIAHGVNREGDELLPSGKIRRKR